ncbi:MAG: hypothetical protein Kow0062_27720 [Acidobacteriota bacterium]
MQVLVANDARLLAELRRTALGRRHVALRVIDPAGDPVEQAARIAPSAVILADGEICPDPLVVCHRMRARPETCAIPLIVIGLSFHRARLEAAGVDAFVARPLRRGELHAALERVLALPARSAVRSRIDRPATLTVGSGERQPVVVRDVSMSGAFLEGDRLPDPGEPARLAVEISGRALELPARVVRRGPGFRAGSGAALAFEQVDVATRIFLGAVARQGAARSDAVACGERP